MKITSPLSNTRVVIVLEDSRKLDRIHKKLREDGKIEITYEGNIREVVIE